MLAMVVFEFALYAYARVSLLTHTHDGLVADAPSRAQLWTYAHLPFVFFLCHAVLGAGASALFHQFK
jgi:hypothetical protein